MRTNKDSVMFRLANAAFKCGFTPNMITALGLSFGVASGAILALHFIPWALAFGLISVFCDVLDGTLARKFRLESRSGLILDSVADRISEGAVVVGAFVGGVIQPLGFLAVVGSMSLFLLRSLSCHYGLRTDYAWFGRFERLVFILLGLLLPVVWASTLCFVAAGVFGLISSTQISVKLVQSISSEGL
jgi:phosphatidylglycerophosphate synthase